MRVRGFALRGKSGAYDARRGNPLDNDIHEKSFTFGKIFFREVIGREKRLTAGVNPPLRFSGISYFR